MKAAAHKAIGFRCTHANGKPSTVVLAQIPSTNLEVVYSEDAACPKQKDLRRAPHRAMRVAELELPFPTEYKPRHINQTGFRCINATGKPSTVVLAQIRSTNLGVLYSEDAACPKLRDL